MSEINVTPMVDVMLVLLIIFMVSAPLLTVGVPIDLPQTQAKSLDQDKEPLTISVNTEGKVFLQNTEIALDELVPKLKAITEARGGGIDERIYVRGDKQGRLRYGDEGDGTALGRRLPPGRAGDGGRAGAVSDRQTGRSGMKTGLTISGVGHAALLLWGVLSFSPPSRFTPSRPRRCRSTSSPTSEFSQMTNGRQERAEGRDADAAGREGRRADAGRRSDRQGRQDRRSRPPTDAPPPPRAQAARAQGRRSRRSRRAPKPIRSPRP